jgi:hypothetical protein
MARLNGLARLWPIYFSPQPTLVIHNQQLPQSHFSPTPTSPVAAPHSSSLVPPLPHLSLHAISTARGSREHSRRPCLPPLPVAVLASSARGSRAGYRPAPFAPAHLPGRRPLSQPRGADRQLPPPRLHDVPLCRSAVAPRQSPDLSPRYCACTRHLHCRCH